MKLRFWHKKDRIKLSDIEREAVKAHKKNISKIVQSRGNADKVIKVLEENNITLSLAKAIGHR